MNKFLLNIPESMETARLHLRAYKTGDGPRYYAASLRNRDHLAEYEAGNVLMHLQNEEHAEAVVRELAADWIARKHFFIGLFEKTGGEWLGQVYVGPTNWALPEFTIGYVADVEHEGKGYISEAVLRVLQMLFEELGAHRVKSDCNEHNIRSRWLLERCGFQREGHLRENKKNADGSFHGDYLYGLLRQEYVALVG